MQKKKKILFSHGKDTEGNTETVGTQVKGITISEIKIISSKVPVPLTK